MEEELASNPNYKDIKLVATVYGDDDDTKSFQEAQGLLQAYPNLKGIISPTTVGIAATARYLSTSDYKGKVALTGLGLPNEMRPVRQGRHRQGSSPSGTRLSSATSRPSPARRSLDGTITGEEGDTFDAGDLGEKEVGDGGIVIVGPPTTLQRRQHRRLRLLGRHAGPAIRSAPGPITRPGAEPALAPVPHPRRPAP